MRNATTARMARPSRPEIQTHGPPPIRRPRHRTAPRRSAAGRTGRRRGRAAAGRRRRRDPRTRRRSTGCAMHRRAASARRAWPARRAPHRRPVSHRRPSRPRSDAAPRAPAAATGAPENGRGCGSADAGAGGGQRSVGQVRVERVGHRGRTREALAGIGRHGAPDDRLEGRRDPGPDLGHLGRAAGQPCHRDRRGAVALEGSTAGEHLEEHDAEGVDVRRRGGLLAARLFGAEVVDRAERRPGQRHLGLGDGPGDPEVGDLHAAVAREHDVAGLHVAVDDPPGVGGRQGAGDLRGDPGGLARRERPVPAHDRGQVLPVDELHDDERAVLVLAEVVDGHDVGMVERGGGERLLAEARAEVRIATVLGAEDLDRDVAIELGVVGAVDAGHAPLPEELHQPIPPAEDAA